MAVSYVADTQSLQNVNSTGVTFSHAGGTCDGICVAVIMRGTGQTVSSITWNSVDIPTTIGSADLTGGTGGRITVKGLAPADTGTHNVIVTLNAQNSDFDVSAITYLGVHTSGGASSFNGWQTAINSTLRESPIDISVTVTTGASGDVVQDATISISNNGDTTGTDWQDNSGGTNTQGKHYAGGASVVATESWDFDNDVVNTKRIVAWNISQPGAAVLEQTHIRFRNNDGTLAAKIY